MTQGKHSKTNGGARSAASAPVPSYAYYGPRERIGTPQLDDPDRISSSQWICRYDDSGLVGASAFDAVTYSAAHLSFPVDDEMRRSLQVIEKKFHGGQYDEQAMPLVRDFLEEMRVMAKIEVERKEVYDQRVSDIKCANVVAREAVAEQRRLREASIDTARAHSQALLSKRIDEMEESLSHRFRVWRDARRAAYTERRAARDEAKAAQRQEAEQRRREEEQARQKHDALSCELELARQEQTMEIDRERTRIELEKMAAEAQATQEETLARQAAASRAKEAAEAEAARAQAEKRWAQLELALADKLSRERLASDEQEEAISDEEQGVVGAEASEETVACPQVEEPSAPEQEESALEAHDEGVPGAEGSEATVGSNPLRPPAPPKPPIPPDVPSSADKNSSSGR